MGYFLPWLFIKIFHLNVSERGLYIFNNLLFAISAGLFIWLLTIVYKGNKNGGFLCLFGGLLYSMLPELLHGMGNRLLASVSVTSDAFAADYCLLSICSPWQGKI